MARSTFTRWGRLNHGCWDSWRFLGSFPGILVVWIGDERPKRAIKFYSTDNVQKQAKDLNKTNIWFSAIYTGDISPEGRQVLLKDILLKNQEELV